MTQMQALLPKARITKKGFEERYCEVNQWNKAVRIYDLLVESSLSISEGLLLPLPCRRRMSPELSDSADLPSWHGSPSNELLAC